MELPKILWGRVEEVQEKANISRDMALFVLRKYLWDIETFENKYFDNYISFIV